MLALRVVVSLLVVPAAVVVAKDAALTEVAQRTWCLDHRFAQTTTALSQDLCFTVPVPR